MVQKALVRGQAYTAEMQDNNRAKDGKLRGRFQVGVNATITNGSRIIVKGEIHRQPMIKFR